MIKGDETLICELLEDWAEATRLDKRDEVLAHHDPNVVIYDVLPPLKYESAAAYRASWDEWQPQQTEPGIFALHDLTVIVGHDVAFAYGFIHCGGTKPDGTTFEDWIRATFCLRKLAGEWRITHQHNSAPMKVRKS